MSYSPKQPFRLNQDLTVNKDYTCGTECLLRFSFQEQSTSFRTCIEDSSNNPILRCPYIKITNSFLSNTSNPGTVGVNFQNNNYWFDSIYLTKPGFTYIDYEIQSLYPQGILNTLANASDASACSLLVVSKDSTGNYLTIVQSVLNRASSSTSTPGATLTNIINNINSNLVGMDISFSDPVNGAQCGISELTISTININNLIPTNNKYFYYSQQVGSVHYNYIIMYGDIPIILRSDIIDLFNDFFTDKSSTNKLYFRNMSTSSSDKIIPGSDGKVFVSSGNPSTNLAQGEDDIYIRCQPTDQEGTTLVSGTSVAPDQQPFSMESAFSSNMFTQVILGIVIMVIIIKGSEFILKNGTKAILKSA